jgi:diketogulonate reductase-like aldo/keto reductase
LTRLASAEAASVADAATAASTQPGVLRRRIPSSGQEVPAVGMGTWQTFTGRDLDRPDQLEPLAEVLRIFHAAGGRVVDSSPMYGSAEDVAGLLSERLGINADLFMATKVWTSGKEAGVKQMEASLAKLRRKSIELMQVHNLVDWQQHLETLREWKQAGRIEYIGITHHAPGKFEEMENIIAKEKIDFVQLPYSVAMRSAELRLIPAAKENGVAILVMQPLRENPRSRGPRLGEGLRLELVRSVPEVGSRQ